MKWHEALKAYFGLKLTDQEVTDWGLAIQDQTKADGREVAEAVTWASFKDRSNYAGKPTLKDIRMWVFWKRKEDKGDTYEEEQDGCEACGDGGWILSYHGIYHQNGAHIPCACSKGQQRMVKAIHEFPENIYRPLAIKAVKEQARCNKEAEEMAKELV